MKMTNKDLKRIIQEELKAVLREEEKDPSLTDEEWEKIERFINSGDESYYNDAFSFAEDGGTESLNKVADMIYEKDGNKSLFYLLEKSKEYGDFNFFSTITNLDLSKNKLKKLPASMVKLKNLTYLRLNSNKLSSLPDWIGNLTNLIQLSVSNNKLSSLPESIGNLKSLRILDLGENFILSSERKKIKEMFPDIDVYF